MEKINISIVLYHNRKEQIEKLICNILNTKLEIKLYLVDNSSNNDLKEVSKVDNKIKYIFNNANLGFGKAHNIALRKSIGENVPYHLVLNPDVYFDEGVLEELYDFMEKSDVRLVMPKVLYPNGAIQYLCKLLPTPFDLFVRRFLNFGPFKNYIEKRNENCAFRFTGDNKKKRFHIYLDALCLFKNV